MSIWTHITGTIRVDDSTLFFNNKGGVDLSKLFIRDTWEHPNENGNLPTGSEGSLDVEFITRSNDDGIDYRKTIAFFGDLRGFETADCDEVREWWKNIAMKLHEVKCSVRQAVLEINPEDGETIILTERDMNTPAEEPWE